MKKLLILLGLVIACGLGYQLNQTVNVKVQVADTLRLLTTAKEEARTRWTNQPDPADMSQLKNTVPWDLTLEAKFHARGTLDANRLIQLIMPVVPTAVCANLLQALANEYAQGLWLRVDINAAQLSAPIDLATRKRACSGAPDISVYFRF